MTLKSPRFQSQTLSTEAATLRTLNTFAVDLMAIPNVDDLFWYVARNVVGQLKFIDCVIYRADDAQTELIQVAALGEKNPYGRSIINPLRIPFGEGITGRTAKTREAIVVHDLAKDQSYIADTQPARSEICVPLVFGNRVVGVIDSEHPEPNVFGQAELDVLTTIAAMTSAKLELLEEAARSTQRYHDLVQSHAHLSLETSNRKALETELFEARKSEAIGRLSGRFAHDFNNLLTVISGNLELIESEIKEPVSRACLHDAQTAAARGANLIRDMLAYAQRARLDPQSVDLNVLLAKTCDQVGSRPETPFDLMLLPNLWPVHIDAACAETAFLNLITNAMEAMPDGGQLRITTENVTHDLAAKRALTSRLVAGSYVRVSFSDNGIGIAQADLQLIFDPFYTTKAVGAGTGLSLSMVMGFVHQSGGAVAVTSDAQRGSTFQLYFPAIVPGANDLLTTIR